MLGGVGDGRQAVAQWYVALVEGAEIGRLEAVSQVAIGLAANVGVHIMTGSPDSARRLALNEHVRWVGPRPSHHKLDSTLRSLIDAAHSRDEPPRRMQAGARRTANAGGEEERRRGLGRQGGMAIRTLVATLVSRRTHSQGAGAALNMTHFGVSAHDFVRECNAEFDRRGWGSRAVAVSDARLALHLDPAPAPVADGEGATRGGASEGLREGQESLESVVAWLSTRWEVLWIEPLQTFRPAVRYANKLLTVPFDVATYQDDVMRKATVNALSTPVQTGSLQVDSVGGSEVLGQGGSGRFCLQLKDVPTAMRVVTGTNGSHASFLSPLIAAQVAAEHARLPGHKDGQTRIEALTLTLPHGAPPHMLHDGYFVGMQIDLVLEDDNMGSRPVVARDDCLPYPAELFSPAWDGGRYAPKPFPGLQRPVGCPRLVSAHNAGSGRVVVYPPWKLVAGQTLVGVKAQVRPLLQAGDEITVLADARRWSAAIELDWLREVTQDDKKQRVTAAYAATADQRLRIDCARQGSEAVNLHAGLASTATFLRELGFGPLHVRCDAAVQQTGVATVQSEAAAAVSDKEQRLSVCTDVCRNESGVAALEALGGVCVFNVTQVTAEQGPAGTPSSVCTCRFNGPLALKIHVKLPEGNPLWDQGLNGSGQVVGLADTGLDVSNCLLSEGDEAAADAGRVRPAPVSASKDSAVVDLTRRKVAGYARTGAADCAQCDTCAKRIPEDRFQFFGSAAAVAKGSTFRTALPHRCGDKVISPALREAKCCGHTTSASSARKPPGPCARCTCGENNVMEKLCSTTLQTNEEFATADSKADDDCDEKDCVHCCHACGADARLWPRRYDRYGAEMEVDLIAKANAQFDFEVPVRLWVLTRDDYETYVKWEESNPGLDPDKMPAWALPKKPPCLNDCSRRAARQTFRDGARLKLPPSRFGYGVVITNAQVETVERKNFVIQGMLREGAGLQLYTAAQPCGDESDDAGGHGTLCASVAAGALDTQVGSRLERVSARPFEGIAKGAHLFMFDLSAGSRGADNISVPLDVYATLLQPTYARGVRILSNSWSCYFPQVACDAQGCVPTRSDYCNQYSTAAHDMDRFVFDHPQMLLLAAAGDANALANEVAQESIRSPGTCKNCLSVGSSHSFHAALVQAVPYMDTMEQLSAPAQGHRAVCPKYLVPADETRWRAPDAAGDGSSGSDKATPPPASAGGGSVPQTTPVGGGVGVGAEAAAAVAEDKLAVPLDCCNDDPRHNAVVTANLKGLDEQLALFRSTGQPQVSIVT